MSYDALLDLCFASRRPTRPPWSRQYMVAFFFHDAEQRRLIDAKCAAMEERWQETLHVEVLPADSFYAAEDYHQKYYLQRQHELMSELRAVYPDFEDVVNSTAAARLNGFLGGARTHRLQNEDWSRYGLSATAGRILQKQARRRG